MTSRATYSVAWLLGGLALCSQAVDGWAARPHWLGQRPQPEGMIVGIGVAPQGDGLAAARQLAKDRALQDIAGQLETQVQSRVQILESEQGETVHREYRAAIETSVAQTLRQVEIVDTWENGEHAWVYARFDVKLYTAQKQAQVERAMAYYKRGAKAASIAEAVGLCLEARRLLRKVGRDPLGKKIDVQWALVKVEGYTQSLFTTVEIKALAEESEVVQEIVLGVEVSGKGGGMVSELPDGHRDKSGFSGLPVVFVQLETGEEVGMGWTDAGGRTGVRVGPQDLTGNSARVEARIELSALAEVGEYDLGRFAMPAAQFALYLERPDVCVYARDHNGQSAAFVVREVLLNAGVQCVVREDEADIVLEIGVHYVDGEPLGRMHFAFVETEWVLREVGTGQVLLEAGHGSVKGAGSSRDQARRAATASVDEQFRAEALDAMVAAIGHWQGGD